MRFRVVFAPEAETQLLELYRYIALAASPEVALRYTDAVVAYCEGLEISPHRGTRRDDIRPGLRLTNYKGRCVIAFAVAVDLISFSACSTVARITRACCRLMPTSRAATHRMQFLGAIS